jgi:hypothetical protein
MMAKTHRDSDIRTVLTVEKSHEYHYDIPPEPVTDLKQIEEIILTEIQQSYDFVKAEIPELHPTQFQETGRLLRKLPMSTIRSWTARNPRSEAFDEELLAALDSICGKGKLVVFDFRYSRDLEFHDLQLCVELGLGIKNFKGDGPPVIEVKRLYSKQPLTASERAKRHVILDPKNQIEKLKRKRDERFRQRFGWRDFSLENRLHRENLADESRLKKAILEITDKEKND